MMHRYPAETIATIEDFRASRWKAAVEADPNTGLVLFSHSLSRAAAQALEEQSFPEAKVLWILADACSAALRPESVNEPFVPCVSLADGTRSPVPDDLTPDDLALLAEIQREVPVPWIQARLADILWLRGRPKNFQHAIAAIDAYRAIPIEPKEWPTDGMVCWHRAISLARQLGKGAGSRLAEMEDSLLAAATSDETDDSFHRVSLGRLLYDTNLGSARAEQLGESFAATGTRLTTSGRHDTARVFFELAAQWLARADVAARLADLTCLIAESYVSEAKSRGEGMLGLDFYEKAIQTYRRVPKAFRAARDVDTASLALHKLLSDAGKTAVGQMKTMSTAPMDISDVIEGAKASVSGRKPLDALAHLANVTGGAKRKKIEAFSKELLQSSPFQSLFGATLISADGRVVAKTQGMGLGNASNEDGRAALFAKMVNDYLMEVGLKVQAQIWPALHAFTLEHRIRLGDLEQIVARSPSIPEGRVPLVARALFAGFEFDFVSAIHLVAPQIEHLVRWHLKEAGVKTTTLSPTGVENENGLSTLVDVPEIEQIFGEDIAFELKALFCDGHGPNLRNQVAHGLLSFEACQSAPVIYAWWFLLRLAFNPYWNELHPSADPESAVASDPSSAADAATSEAGNDSAAS